jgi:catechol 2,3-dioxygenase-like lactoylglutathione lyase family enzyme
MPRVIGIDHLVLSVSDIDRSKDFYDTVLPFLGFKKKYDGSDFAGWSNRKTLFWIAQADAEGRKHKHRKGEVGFHHYAFELTSRRDIDALGAFLEEHDMPIVDPPGEYNGDENYYAVFFTDPDGMKLEAMVYKPRTAKAAQKSKGAKAARKTAAKKSSRKSKKRRAKR